jgi:pimeloyl-ACP methyl ester carboxylesterase
MKSLLEDLDRAVDFVCVDAPSLSTGDFGWWHRNFRGWERTRDWAVSLFQREPHFDGVFGFSQGAALSSLLVGMRAPDGRVTQQKPLSFEFAVMVGGFRSDSPAHAHLYAAAESYDLPSLHIIGQADRVVPSDDSRVLAAQFTGPVVLEHPGGHIIPGAPAIRRGFADFLDERARSRVTGTRGSP